MKYTANPNYWQPGEPTVQPRWSTRPTSTTARPTRPGHRQGPVGQPVHPDIQSSTSTETQNNHYLVPAGHEHHALPEPDDVAPADRKLARPRRRSPTRSTGTRSSQIGEDGHEPRGQPGRCGHPDLRKSATSPTQTGRYDLQPGQGRADAADGRLQRARTASTSLQGLKLTIDHRSRRLHRLGRPSLRGASSRAEDDRDRPHRRQPVSQTLRRQALQGRLRPRLLRRDRRPVPVLRTARSGCTRPTPRRSARRPAATSSAT